jgi:hypothetical protein
VLVSNLNDGLTAVQRILQEHKVGDAHLSFRKEVQNCRVWFQILASRDINHQILTSLSREPVVTEVETGARPISPAPDDDSDDD